MAGTASAGQSLSAMLTDRNMLALLQTHLSPEEPQTLRLVCTSARVAHDQLAPHLCIRSEHDLRALRGFLRRGCRPHSVVLLSDEIDQDMPRACLRLLGQFIKISASAPLTTAELILPTPALCPGTAQAIAAAFPQLTSLTLDYPVSTAEAAEALSLLLGTGGATAPLIASLQEIDLGYNPELLGALQGASQLRTLEADSMAADAPTVQVLGSLTGLTSLTLGYCGGELLPQLLAPLTSLITLDLGTTRGTLPAPALAGLSALRDFSARDIALDLSALQGLSRLTRLELGSLQSAHAPAIPVPAWHLPPQLAVLSLHSQPPEELRALQEPLPGPLREFGVSFALRSDQHYSPDDGCLLPAAEEALCGAAAALALAGRLDPSILHIGVLLASVSGLLMPVGGEAGPGRRNHGRWLAAIGRTGVRSLGLSEVALSHQDITTIAETCTGLKALQLYRCGPLPMGSLPRLARLTRLERLVLGLSGWSGPDGMGPMAVPANAMGSVLALCSNPDIPVVVTLCHCPQILRGWLRGMVEQLHRDLEAMGLGRGRLVVDD